MFVAYRGNCNKDTIADCLERQLYDEPEWYMNDYVTLEKKDDKYYVQMSVPARSTGNSRFTRKWRLFFKENGIYARENFSFFIIVMFFAIFITGFCSVAVLLSGEYLLSFMSFLIFALFVGVFFFKAKKNVKDFLEKKMQS